MSDERDSSDASPVVNTCEHGDHPAPPNKRFCSDACARCEQASQDDDTESVFGCSGICSGDAQSERCVWCGSEAFGPEGFPHSVTACREYLKAALNAANRECAKRRSEAVPSRNDRTCGRCREIFPCSCGEPRTAEASSAAAWKDGWDEAKLAAIAIVEREQRICAKQATGAKGCQRNVHQAGSGLAKSIASQIREAMPCRESAPFVHHPECVCANAECLTSGCTVMLKAKAVPNASLAPDCVDCDCVYIATGKRRACPKHRAADSSSKAREGADQHHLACILRGRAARFYWKNLTAACDDWIETGSDDRGEIDDDVKSLYNLLTDTWDMACSGEFTSPAKDHLDPPVGARERK